MAKRKNGLFTHTLHPLSGTANSGCIVYGSAGEGVDLGVFVDAPGTIFLSLVAIREAAECAGFSVNEEGIQLEQDNAHLTHEVERLTAELADANASLDAMSVVFARAQASVKTKA